ncbi:hypothetical protein MBLNU459_g2653t1 [Dothideomycetes sp. NU459]
MTLQYSPEYAAAMAPMLEALANAPRPPPGDVESRRAALNGMFGSLLGQMPASPGVTTKVHHTAAKDNHQVAITSYMPPGFPSSGQKSSAVLYYHGGGMIVGSVALYDKIIATQVAACNVPFFAVDYRLAPENPHPTPVEDCFAALEWLSANAGQFNVDNSRIGVMGDSAGGGLAAAVALLARDRKVSPPLAKQILIYPMLDDRNTGPHDYAQLATWSPADNVTGWGALLGDKSGKEDVSPYAAPARVESVAGLPATYIDVGMLDIFRDEDMLYAQRLAQAGIDVEFHLYPGVPHAFEIMAPAIETTRKAMAARAAAVQSI